VAVLGAATPSLPWVSADDAPWDFDQPAVAAPSPAEPATLAGDIFRGLVLAYRENGTNVSIHRCIFHVSCSHFAERALSKYGVVEGGIMFIDRYFYRENQAAKAFYPLAGESDGTYRLDDSPFVP